MGSKQLNLVGQVFGNLTVLEKGAGKTFPSGNKARTWLCLCKCGNITEVTTSNLNSGNSTSCGCLHKELLSNRVKKHGDSNSSQKRHYLYNTWSGIKSRCLNANCRKYKDWGERGITIYEPWINNYQLFKDYVLSNLGERPKGMSLDRIDNDGNYEPGNLRWATNNIQRINQRIDSRNTTGYTGVYWYKANKKWTASITVKGIQKHLGYFDTKDDAIATRLKAEEQYHTLF